MLGTDNKELELIFDDILDMKLHCKTSKLTFQECLWDQDPNF